MIPLDDLERESVRPRPHLCSTVSSVSATLLVDIPVYSYEPQPQTFGHFVVETHDVPDTSQPKEHNHRESIRASQVGQAHRQGIGLGRVRLPRELQ
jgi:hypothetical protein